MKLRFFNMIEVLLALAISAIGIVGLMGIIPLGLNANREALAETFTADIANSYFSELSRNASKAPDFATFYSSIPFPAGIKDDSFKTEDDIECCVYKNPLSALPTRIPSARDFTEDGIEMEVDESDGKKYFKIFVGKKGTDVLPDFDADLCGWKCYPEDISDAEGAQTDLIRVYLEVSWPVSADYDKREKRIFVREFYNTKAAAEELP